MPSTPSTKISPSCQPQPEYSVSNVAISASRIVDENRTHGSRASPNPTIADGRDKEVGESGEVQQGVERKTVIEVVGKLQGAHEHDGRAEIVNEKSREPGEQAREHVGVFFSFLNPPLILNNRFSTILTPERNP